MARGVNKNETTKVQPTISTQTLRYLDRLVGIGAYGNTPTAVAAYLIQREIDDLIRSGVLRPIARKARR